MSRLTPDKLYRKCNEDDFPFETTDELDIIDFPIVGQERAVSAADFGIKMKKDGYNIYALGPEGTDKRNLLEVLVNKEARNRDIPNDLCYVCNFEEAQKPTAIELPAGEGPRFKEKMDEFAEDLPDVLKNAFESEEYQNRKQSIEEESREEEKEAFEELKKKAEEEGLTIMNTPGGYTFVPLKDGKMMKREEMEELSEEERERLEEKAKEFQQELQQILRRMPEKQRKSRKLQKELDKEFAGYAIKGILDELREEFKEYDQIIRYLKGLREDVLEHVDQILNPGGQNPLQQMAQQSPEDQPASEHPVLWRYTVNVLVNNENLKGAPVVYEDNPTFTNLIGRIEHVSQMGTLTTNFTYIRPGSLHKANGGFLILDAVRILSQPYVWQGLKRAMQSQKIKIETPGDMFGMISTVSLQPDKVDLDLKVVLVGSRRLYYMLCAYDPDFRNLFKVEVDFDDEAEWNKENQDLYARLLSGLVRKHDLYPLHKSAVGRIIEHTARIADDNQKLTTYIRDVIDLMRESDYWTQEDGEEITRRVHVQKAIDEKIYRSSRVKEHSQEAILRETIFIDTEGSKVGQVNGLSVLMLGNIRFGKPTRITARAKLGSGKVLNIEREVELSGPIHSKGVMILSAFLGARYAQDKPLSLSASLVFEQSYGGVDGDSASSTELYALLSAISEIPLKQSLAVTGSVNQHGMIQPIGGVNEKIEGFYDICKERGLTGEQGVLIPKSNVKNLMLKEEVVKAVEANEFHIYAIETIDEGMELMTGKKMGERDKEGKYPKNSINYLVEQRLDEFASIRKNFGSKEEK